jgi:hypothetical protein
VGAIDVSSTASVTIGPGPSRLELVGWKRTVTGWSTGASPCRLGVVTEPATTNELRDLVRTGVLDAELGGLLSVLVAGGLPVLVAGGPASGRESVLRALRTLRRDEAGGPSVLELAARRDPDPRATARRFVAAAAEGLPVSATIDARDLEDVFARLEAPPIGGTRDELSHIGLVLVLEHEAARAGAPSRVVAAHWVRPLARDAHGHVQRLGPAVLATWEPRTASWEHFAWGVIPELAIRLGRKAGDLEREVADQTGRLAASSAG